MQQRRIIILIIVLFIVSSSWLFSVSFNLNDNANWWSVYFDQPKSSSFDFSIENHSDQEKFHYEILKDKDKIFESDVTIKKGSASDITVDPSIIGDAQEKISVSVTRGEENRIIYKNF